MFTSVKKYLEFFHDIKTNATSLKRGEIKKANLNASYGYYILIAVFGGIIGIFFNTPVLAILNALPLFGAPIFLVGNFFYLMTLISAIQLNHYLLKDKHSSFKQVWQSNMGKVAAIFAKNPYLRGLQDKYPPTDAYDNKLQLDDSKDQLKQDFSQFSLFIGKSTGLLSQLWHTSSLAKDQNVMLDINDASKNILTLGGIGSGKTSSIMQPLLLQLLHQGCGGLIFTRVRSFNSEQSIANPLV